MSSNAPFRPGALLFLSQFWRAPRSVGAVWPSSRRLADVMLAPIDFARVRTVVEFGPGTGSFTRALEARLRPGQRYVGIELNSAFYDRLRAEFPRFDFELGSVATFGEALDRRGIATADAIVSGLPWASLPIGLQREAFAEVDRRLAPGGVFVTFAYLQGLSLPGARALRRRLGQQFRSVVRTRIVWGNVPPAFAYICRQ